MSFIEIVKVIASISTPVIVAIFGFLFLRRIESVKAEVAKQSEFHKKWAEQFFGCCQEFMSSIERELAILNFLQGLENPNDEFGTELQKELSRLHPYISELELRIRRSVVFAPKKGHSVTQAANACLVLMGTLVKLGKGSFDEIIEKMNNFNIAARAAHAEMLGVE